VAVRIESEKIAECLDGDDGGRQRHDISPSRTSCRHNVERTVYLSRGIFTGRLARLRIEVLYLFNNTYSMEYRKNCRPYHSLPSNFILHQQTFWILCYFIISTKRR
jgi:hypothetical protein